MPHYTVTLHALHNLNITITITINSRQTVVENL